MDLGRFQGERHRAPGGEDGQGSDAETTRTAIDAARFPGDRRLGVVRVHRDGARASDQQQSEKPRDDITENRDEGGLDDAEQRKDQVPGAERSGRRAQGIRAVEKPDRFAEPLPSREERAGEEWKGHAHEDGGRQ